MARIDTLGNFLTDVADAIRTKKGSSDTILASDFDTEIENLPSGGGADLSEYFYTEITSNTSSSDNMADKIVKKTPDVVVDNSVTNLQYAYKQYDNANVPLPKVISEDNVTNLSYMYNGVSNVASIDVSGLKTNNVTTMSYMFQALGTDSTLKTIIFGSNFKTNKVTSMRSMFMRRSGLTSLDLSSFTGEVITEARSMFSNCSGLIHIDLRNFDFTNISSYDSMFYSVPANCEIIVKDVTQKNWMNTNFPNLTNVKTVAEYEAE